jgi:glycosyltransferase involved in cell wall biosynthesis
MTELPVLMVLSTSLPGARTGGGVVQETVLRHYPRERFVCVSCLPAAEEPSPVLDGVPRLTLPLSPRPRLRGARFYMPVLRAAARRLLAPWCVRRAARFGRRHGVQTVWAALQGEALLLARPLAEALGVPMVGTVWDDPDGWLADGGYDAPSRRFMRRRFREALRKATALSTSGEGMQTAYRREHGVDSVILRHGFAEGAPAPEGRRRRDVVTIGFAGSVYGRDAWEVLYAAVSRLNGSGRVPPIRIRAFGSMQPPPPSDGVEVEARGWQPARVMLRELAEADFCYLPYWFEPAKRRHVELSFPNKFETYVAAGRPVLYHGPAYAGIAGTIRRRGVGLCVHSLDADTVAGAIKRLIREESMREEMAEAARRAFREEFNLDALLRNFARLIGVAPEALRMEGRA